MSKIIGLTGPTGSGKSYACLIAKTMNNLKIIDCDIIARQAVEKGTKGLEALVGAFSKSILKPDGTLNRRELARRAFSSSENTEFLNKTVLPFITEIIMGEIEADKCILLDAPTLFESGINEICDTTVAIIADKETRLSRIMLRDGISKEDALLRINAGKPDGFYRRNAEHIIENNGNIKEYTEKFINIIRNYTEV